MIGCKGRRQLIDLDVVEKAASELGMNDLYVTEPQRSGGAMGDPGFASDARDAMRWLFGNGSARQFAAEEADSQEQSHATSPAELATFVAVEESASVNTAATVQDCEAISPSMENSHAYVFLKSLIPAPAGPEVKQKGSAACLDSIAGVAGPADPLITGGKRNPVTVEAIPSLPLMDSRTQDERPSMAKSSPISLAKPSVPTLDTMNRLPRPSPRTSTHAPLLSWKSWGRYRATRFLTVISVAERQRVSFAVLRKIRQSTFPVQTLLRRWRLDFKRDWIAMINAMALPEIKKSVLHWLSQPIHAHLWQHPKLRLYPPSSREGRGAKR